jgi:hypothetical protein
MSVERNIAKSINLLSHTDKPWDSVDLFENVKTGRDKLCGSNPDMFISDNHQKICAACSLLKSFKPIGWAKMVRANS